nr:PREDICTED: LIM and SH3 domain protein Lasp-like [Bemisia tabaci]
MSKKCARCDKTVYPIEELKCLDKIWHKICFKCQVCSMTLNMRNYKGYNKDPYCEAHIPKAKATTVAETPELKRIAENTKIQSNVKYHAEFEKAKGKLTQVADDPETLRMKQNSKIISNVAYHGDLQKKAEMEQRRNMTGQNGESSGWKIALEDSLRTKEPKSELD